MFMLTTTQLQTASSKILIHLEHRVSKRDTSDQLCHKYKLQ